MLLCCCAAVLLFCCSSRGSRARPLAEKGKVSAIPSMKRLAEKLAFFSFEFTIIIHDLLKL